ncbi:MAG TPA: thiamine phosphate synthase [Nitrospirota bacterium]|nr:thiamine phosphate synthase [Nitrospirota bacterium]
MDFCFYLITDRKATFAGRSLEHVIESAIEGGVKGVLLREKDLPDRELLALAGRVRDLTLRHRVRFLVSGRTDVAMAVGADGVHLSAGSLPPEAAREVVGDEKYVGVSTHSIEEAVRAKEGGADFITFGPVFFTESKAKYGEPAGLDALARVCAEVDIPVFALGGITEENVLDTLKAGAFGVAVISAVLSAGDPAAAARGILSKMRSYKIRRCV